MVTVTTRTLKSISKLIEFKFNLRLNFSEVSEIFCENFQILSETLFKAAANSEDARRASLKENIKYLLKKEFPFFFFRNEINSFSSKKFLKLTTSESSFARE